MNFNWTKCSIWLIPQIWTLFCVSGAFWQASVVSEMYFSYNTFTISRSIFPETYTQPQVSICFPIILVVNWTMVKGQHPEVMEMLNFSGLSADEVKTSIQLISTINERRQLQAAFTDKRLSGLINNMTYFAPDLVTKCYQVDNVSLLINEVDCWTSFTDDAFFKEDDICYGFINPLNYEQFLSKKVLGWNGLVQRFFLNTNTSGKLAFFYTSNDQRHIPYHGSGFAIEFSMNRTNKEFTMTSDRYMNKRLQAPYDTDCRRYVTSGFSSQDDCFETCERNNTVKEFSALVPGPTFNCRNDQLMKYNMRAVNGISSDEEKIIEKISLKCENVCSQIECDERVIVPMVKSINTDKTSRISIVIPQSPDKLSEFSPVISIAEYLIQVGSIIGFWTGMSLLRAYDLLETSLCHVIGNRKRRVSKSWILQRRIVKREMVKIVNNL